MALDDVDLERAPGELRGLLGLNGAGKTTLLRTLFGLVEADSGSIELLGRETSRGRRPALSGVAGLRRGPEVLLIPVGRANLELLAELDDGGGAGIEEALTRVGLGQRAADRVGSYSTGMRQRLGLAAACFAPRVAACSCTRSSSCRHAPRSWPIPETSTTRAPGIAAAVARPPDGSGGCIDRSRPRRVSWRTGQGPGDQLLAETGDQGQRLAIGVAVDPIAEPDRARQIGEAILDAAHRSTTSPSV